MSDPGKAERIYQGRRCFVNGQSRTRQRRGWGSYNVYSVIFLDDENKIAAVEAIPAGRFNKGSNPTGRLMIPEPGGAHTIYAPPCCKCGKAATFRKRNRNTFWEAFCDEHLPQNHLPQFPIVTELP